MLSCLPIRLGMHISYFKGKGHFLCEMNYRLTHSSSCVPTGANWSEMWTSVSLNIMGKQTFGPIAGSNVDYRDICWKVALVCCLG